MSFPSNRDVRGLSSRPLSRLLLALSAVLLLVNACTDDEETPFSPYQPSPPIVVTPGNGGSENISLDGGDVVLSDGGTFTAKPSCTGGSCQGACPDGGVFCAGNCGFLAAVSYELSGAPQDIASDDLNGDGSDDLVTVNGVGNTAAVLLNRKSGLFQTPTLLPTGSTPSSVLLADVTGDQKPDVLTASADALRVFKNKGDGTFPTATNTGVSQASDDMVIGSFGGSQRVALLGGSSEKLLVLKSNGNGSFASPVSIEAPSSPIALTVQDFNGDSRSDLAIIHGTCSQAAESCQSVGVMVGKSDGTFEAQRFTPIEGSPRGLVAAKLGTDPNMDLVVADTNGDRVLVFSGQGDGSFLVTPAAYATGDGPRQLVLADINRDSVKDLLVVNAADSRVSLLLGQPSGAFSQQVSLNVLPQGEGLQGMTVADFDKDGAQDLAVLSGSGIQMLWGSCR